MEYNIFGGNLPAVTIRLNQGESIYTQSGGYDLDDGKYRNEYEYERWII